MDLISSNEFKNEIEGLGGYDLKDIGKIISETYTINKNATI